MNGLDQLPLFEPDEIEATRLLTGYMGAMAKSEAAAERFSLLDLRGATAAALRSFGAAYGAAMVCAFYLDLLEASA